MKKPSEFTIFEYAHNVKDMDYEAHKYYVKLVWNKGFRWVIGDGMCCWRDENLFKCILHAVRTLRKKIIDSENTPSECMRNCCVCAYYDTENGVDYCLYRETKLKQKYNVCDSFMGSAPN